MSQNQKGAPKSTKESKPTTPSIHDEPLLGFVTTYAENMQPGKPLKEEELGRHCRAFYLGLTNLLNHDPNAGAKETYRLWSILLDYIANDKTKVFTGDYFYRGYTYSQFSNDTQEKAMQAMTNLIIMTANPETRFTNLRMIDLEKTMELGWSDLARSRIMGFYKT